MAEDGNSLSRSMEDYLEAIYNLKVRDGVARVKDIADAIDVRMPSVTSAIYSLVEKGLVRHEPYESVELTDQGLDRARAVAHRHSAVREFLTSVLGLDEQRAQEEACGIEHAIQPETLERLLKLVDFLQLDGRRAADLLDDLRAYLAEGKLPRGPNARQGRGLGPHGPGRHGFRPTITTTRLSDLRPGSRGRIAFVSGRGPIRNRLMDMGLTPNANFVVIRAAPLGDPIEIKVRGYLLSLRRSEASHIEVELE